MNYQHQFKINIDNKDNKMGIASSIMSFVFTHMLPEIGTVSFYLVFCLYTYILAKIIFFFVEYINDYYERQEYDEDSNIKKKFLVERKIRQKEAEKILGKYFKVKTLDEFVKEDQNEVDNSLPEEDKIKQE